MVSIVLTTAVAYTLFEREDNFLLGQQLCGAGRENEQLVQEFDTLNTKNKKLLQELSHVNMKKDELLQEMRSKYKEEQCGEKKLDNGKMGIEMRHKENTKKDLNEDKRMSAMEMWLEDEGKTSGLTYRVCQMMTGELKDGYDTDEEDEMLRQ